MPSTCLASSDSTSGRPLLGPNTSSIPDRRNTRRWCCGGGVGKFARHRHCGNMTYARWWIRLGGFWTLRGSPTRGAALDVRRLDRPWILGGSPAWGSARDGRRFDLSRLRRLWGGGGRSCRFGGRPMRLLHLIAVDETTLLRIIDNRRLRTNRCRPSLCRAWSARCSRTVRSLPQHGLAPRGGGRCKRRPSQLGRRRGDNSRLFDPLSRSGVQVQHETGGQPSPMLEG